MCPGCVKHNSILHIHSTVGARGQRDPSPASCHQRGGDRTGEECCSPVDRALGWDSGDTGVNPGPAGARRVLGLGRILPPPHPPCIHARTLAADTDARRKQLKRPACEHPPAETCLRQLLGKSRHTRETPTGPWGHRANGLANWGTMMIETKTQAKIAG